MQTITINFAKQVYGLMMVILIALLMALFSPVASAQTVHKTSDFNHMKTGFPLTGLHVTVECETCHTGGIFKGTPTNCAGCHSAGRRVAATIKPASHMDTNAACDTCHTNTVSFLGARFNHIGVQPKACMTCHNSMTGPGKPGGHIATTLSCDSCHRTSAWIPAGFNHTGTFLVCSNCHDGSQAKGKPVNHVPTTAACDTCHKSGFTTFAGAIYDHTGQAACETCHIAGTYGAKTKVAGHIPTGNIRCDNCHVGTGFVSFAGSTMNHSVVEAVPINCSTCHNGSYTSQGSFLGGAKAKTPNHVVTTAECGTCHLGRSSFLGGLFNHATASPPVAGICQTCHNGIKALGKTNTPTHNGTTASCDTCHGNANNYTSFAGAAFSHANVVAGTCGTCHLGQSASVKTKTQTHIPTTGNACDSCHTATGYTSFINPTMNHSVIGSTQCATCHSGSYTTEGVNYGGALAKPSTHIATSASCDTCHHSFTTFAGVVYDHSGVTPTTCGSCHLTGIGQAKMKPGGHIPTTSNACDACHKTGYTSFTNPTVNHAAVTTFTCITCHNGSYTTQGIQYGGAKWTGSVTNHIPYATSATCSTCHTGFTSFITPLTNSTTMHTVGIGMTIPCRTCHASGTNYLGVTGKKMSVTHNKSTGVDCAQSGCHAPGGGTGTAYIRWTN